jgi:hypothetical protein
MSQAKKKKATAIQKALEKEKKTYGFMNDGGGKRYRAALLLLEIEDYQGLLEYYDWFYTHFPDDVGTPELHLCWIFAAAETGRDDLLRKHLVKLEDVNTYVLPKLLGQHVERLEKWEWSNYATEDYADYLLEGQLFKERLTPKMEAALTAITQSEVYQNYKQQHLECLVARNSLPAGPERSRVIAREKEVLEAWVVGLG